MRGADRQPAVRRDFACGGTATTLARLRPLPVFSRLFRDNRAEVRPRPRPHAQVHHVHKHNKPRRIPNPIPVLSVAHIS